MTRKKIPGNIWNDLKENRLLGMIIPKKYNGLELNHHEQSQIVQKISTASNTVGILVMVPNSLGPAELLLKYGTLEQKEQYLPNLASADLIPCFGLTGPLSGSDAASMKDKGTVFRGKDGCLWIRLRLEKRYITLAPIANLVGVAFHLEDPQSLLTAGKTGITVALVPANELVTGPYHRPMDVPFPNGTIYAEDVEIPVSYIIGGEKKAGEGWRMLMECLAVGRAVSLPACAVGNAKLASLYTGSYAVFRTQFRKMIGDMEGVQEKLALMASETLKITAMQHMTNSLLDHGHKPSVISAIIKYESTERSRKILLAGMDVVAGAAICKGPRNILANMYQSVPIGITVEGSNTLTRSLIIFGQGLIRSHPYLKDMIDHLTAHQDKQFLRLVGLLLRDNVYNTAACLLYQLIPVSRNDNTLISKYTHQFAVTANLMLLLGKEFKSNQILSGRMSDIMGSLYILQALEWWEIIYPEETSKALLHVARKEEIIKIEQAFRSIAENFPLKAPRWFLKIIIGTGVYRLPRVTNQDIVQASKTLTEDAATRNMLAKDIFHSERLSFFLNYHDEVRSYHEKKLLTHPGKDFQENEPLEKIVLEGITVDSFY
jgi:acyl-CoA dehydrogenase